MKEVIVKKIEEQASKINELLTQKEHYLALIKDIDIRLERASGAIFSLKEVVDEITQASDLEPSSDEPQPD